MSQKWYEILGHLQLEFMQCLGQPGKLSSVFQNPPVTVWQTGFIFIKCCFSEKQSYYVTLKSTYLMLCPTVFLGVCLWIILQLLPQALVYDK